MAIYIIRICEWKSKRKMPPTYININESKSNEKSMPVTFERSKTSARFMSVPEGKKKEQEASKKEYPPGNVIRAI